MDLFETKIHDYIKRHELIRADEKVIVAFSGGADSMALLNVLVSLGYDCRAAHCNFHLRGEESNRDMRHALSVAKQLGVECDVIDFDVESYQKEHGVSLEMACRELRYEWFEKLRTKYSPAVIAVAHHRNDNIETMLLNLLRGTGIAGLCGMKPRHDNIIRPMLECTRKEVEDYLARFNIEYVTDSTNFENDVKRNKLRNLVLPEIYALFPDAENTMAKTIENLRLNLDLYSAGVKALSQKYVSGTTIKLSQLIAEQECASTLLFEIIREYGFNASQADDIIASGHSGRRFESQTHSAIIDRGRLLIYPLKNDSQETQQQEFTIKLCHNKNASYPINLTFEEIENKDIVFDRSGETLYLDYSAMDGNAKFEVRRWQNGDKMQPYGMKGRKLVSDILTDAKLSIIDKENVWVLTRNEEILWIIGLRTSCHFPVTLNTKKVIKICYFNKSV